jgi:Na+-driven multidrug efflux pump
MSDTSSKRHHFDRSIVEGPITKAVWKLAWPTMLQNVILAGHFTRAALSVIRFRQEKWRGIVVDIEPARG